jgi:uncharacterized protein YukE
VKLPHFPEALRAEVDAVVARYDALVQVHLASVALAHEGQLALLRNEGEALRARADDQSQRISKLEQMLKEREGQLRALRETAEREASRAHDAAARADQSLTEAKKQIDALEAQLQRVADQSQVFEDVFAGEVDFVRACAPLQATSLLAAIQDAAGVALAPEPSVYGALKRERLDAVLARAVRERGRTVVDRPLVEVENRALQDLARAAGCTLIAPALGARYEADAMEKIATSPDPSEEGNVLACLMPGLRLADSEGALVFPKVKVAVG